jgi:Flp pilus assembly protein TadG
MSRRRRHHNIRDERGQTMVEFTLVVPIICLILFGILQFGALYNDYLAVTDASRVGARKAATSRHASSPAGAADAAARASATDLDPGKFKVFVTASPGWEHGADVTVETRYPYQISLLGLVVASGELSSKTTERVE